jgi:hypothetical protein
MPEDKLIEAMAREMEPFGFMTEHEEAMNAARDDARSALAAIEQGGYVVAKAGSIGKIRLLAESALAAVEDLSPAGAEHSVLWSLTEILAEVTDEPAAMELIGRTHEWLRSALNQTKQGQ